MSARFHRFADFAPDDVEWWQGEAGLLESYVGEWLPAVVRVRQGRVRVEAPVTGAESAVRVLRDFRIGGACAARADGWRLFGGGFAAAVVAADAAAHLRFPAAAARDAFVAAVSSCAATARVGSGYRFGAVLGRGAQGVVRLVAGKDGARRAGKALPFRTSKEKRVACREFELMRRVGRECATAHVVRLLEAFECDAGGPKCVLVLELCSGGDLYSRIVERGTYSEAACAGAVRQVLGGLGALHGAGVVHLDVKPANLLYASLARGAPLKIVDFGLAASVADTGDEPRPWVLRGTPGYMAPELVTDGAATPKCDVFALGVVAHALLTGREPFCLDRKATAREIFACTAQCRVAYDNEDWVGISTAAKLFVAETLERNPKHRPDVGALLDHAWLAAAPARGGAASPGPAPDAAPAPRRSLDRARARLSCLAADRVGARRSSRGGASDAGAGDRDAVETLLEGVDADAAWFDEEIESIRRLFRAVSGDGGEHLSIVDFGRVMAALDMPFTPDVLFPIYDRTRAGTVSAEDFARCVTAVRRAMVSDDAETFPPGSPAYEHAGLAFDAYHRALSPPRLDGAGRPAITPDHVAAAIAAHNADLAARRAAAPAPSRGETSPRGGRPRADVDAVVAASLLARAAPEATDGVDRETFIDGAIRRCPLLFGVFFLSVSYKMERLFERDAAPRGGPSDSFGPDSGVLE